MNANKLQDLILAMEDAGKWDLKDVRNQAMLTRLVPKLVETLKEVGLEVKCDNCSGRGYLTGTTGGEIQTRGKCPKCKGTGSKYFFLEV